MTTGHIDAETLAAWADDRLTSSERAEFESHAADCARCQALVAAMVRTAPASKESEARSAAWWHPASGWLVPAGAIAAVLVLAVVTSRLVRAPAAPGPGQAVAEAPAQVRAPEAAAAPPPASPSRGSSPDSTRAAAHSAENEAVGGALLERLDTKAKAEKHVPAAGGAPSASSQPPPPPAAAPPAAAQAGAAAAKAEGARAFAADALREARAEPVLEIVSSSPASRWRLTRTPGAIQHSIDGGSTWTLQQTGVAVELTAGASPTASVCWFVGRGGAIVLTVDGRTWRRVPFGEAVDLVAVQATDALAATVTTADGRKFATTDGGATWEEEKGATDPKGTRDSADVQEKPAGPF